MAPTYSSLYLINAWRVCEGKQNINNTLFCPYRNELCEYLLLAKYREMMGEPERCKLCRQTRVHLHALAASSIIVTGLDQNANCSKFSSKHPVHSTSVTGGVRPAVPALVGAEGMQSFSGSPESGRLPSVPPSRVPPCPIALSTRAALSERPVRRFCRFCRFCAKCSRRGSSSCDGPSVPLQVAPGKTLICPLVSVNRRARSALRLSQRREKALVYKLHLERAVVVNSVMLSCPDEMQMALLVLQILITHFSASPSA